MTISGVANHTNHSKAIDADPVAAETLEPLIRCLGPWAYPNLTLCETIEGLSAQGW
jgi:hypothetical protein